MNSKHIMMKGTEGNFDYLLVARKGHIGLGLKPNVVMPGKLPDTTYVGARLRSAMLPAGAIPENDVPNIQHMKLGLSDAWPHVEWENNGKDRCSTQLGVLLKSTPQKDPAKLLPYFSRDKIPTQMADYTIGLAGMENLVVDRDVIIDWLFAFYLPITQKIEKAINLEKAVDKEIEGLVGNFAMTQEILKKAYAAVDTLGLPGSQSEWDKMKDEKKKAKEAATAKKEQDTVQDEEVPDFLGDDDDDYDDENDDT